MNDLTRRYPILQHFSNNSLIPQQMLDLCQQLNAIAYKMARTPKNQETEIALRKLLEARDCYIRSGMM